VEEEVEMGEEGPHNLGEEEAEAVVAVLQSSSDTGEVEEEVEEGPSPPPASPLSRTSPAFVEGWGKEDRQYLK